MPVDISAASKKAAGPASASPKTSSLSPKFFSKNLTGNGAQTKGILSVALKPFDHSWAPFGISKRRTQTSSNTTREQIPMSVMHPDLRTINRLRNFRTTGFATIAEHKTKKDLTLALRIVPASIVIEKGKDASGNATRSVKHEWLFQLFVNPFGPGVDKVDVHFEQALQTTSTANLTSAMSNRLVNSVLPTSTPNPRGSVMSLLTTQPMTCLETLKKDLALTYSDWKVPDQNVYDNYLSNYSAYVEVQQLVEAWTTDGIVDVATAIIDDIAERVTMYKKTPDTNDWVYEIKKAKLDKQLTYMSSFDVALDAYARIFQHMNAKFSSRKAIRHLSNFNLNLMLFETIESINREKDKLSQISVPNPAPMLDPRFSRQQRGAITAPGPLTVTQSAAGTGKSTVINGRIGYMMACGVKPEDITVLSFTNAAADHIRAMNANIDSRTIASLIHEIYNANHPKHDMSTLETIVNSIEILGSKTDFERKFVSILKNLTSSSLKDFQNANAFIEDNFDEVMKTLDVIGQTSLELEIIVCHQTLDSLTVPKQQQTRHLLIDEVQDTSVFEFIFLLNFARKNQMSVFAVGDGSQTLFAFRAADPRALNSLEASAVFDIHKLTTNYRSKKAILDFANTMLSTIEANQYAQLQLEANSMKPITENEFRNAVIVEAHPKAKTRDFEANLPEHVVNGAPGIWIKQKVAAGEQVAVLASSRRVANAIGKALKDAYPGSVVMSLTPDRFYASTLLSTYLSQYYDNLKFAPAPNAADIIYQDILKVIPMITRNTKRNITQLMTALDRWYAAESGRINALSVQMAAGAITADQFRENVRDAMLAYERQQNARIQNQVSERNRKMKEAATTMTPNFIVSTVHSAKGLEFDNVIVIYNDEKHEEEHKRMAYVSFTRAKKSEFIIAHSQHSNVLLKAQHDKLCDEYRARDIAAMGAGVPASGDQAGTQTDDDQTDTSDTQEQ